LGKLKVVTREARELKLKERNHLIYFSNRDLNQVL